MNFIVSDHLSAMFVLPTHITSRGVLYESDCLQILPKVIPGSVDLIFADPPFNLKKIYGPRASDDRTEASYLEWCRAWIKASVPLLSEGGAFYIYNIPKWNMYLSQYLLEEGLDFRHWIAVEQKTTLPIQGRLYPSHYSLLYFTKGKPRVFNKIRTPIEKCRHCGGEIRDYGGHRSAMNPNGVNLKDIWTDIPPVRHRKFKHEKRKANALSTKLLERVINISTNENDLVLDPFGGSGTTFAVCEKLNRRWIGVEIESTDAIIERLEDGVEYHINTDFVCLSEQECLEAAE